ncbi:MAG: DUF6316 family protein [Porticoccus sp.]|jgi:hypothetical protein|uniref:DUF6316 family protein n=1 Tax=Porticoccus sp. TaxID=2024853 RepID=UPI000C0CA6E5|nr:MAG: hypothetical protein COA29_03235 [Porticoccus sp.]|tara:strand:+ start:581 stop:820 length:240 start_codon:yes stop_codon:yes gene_type:complete
MTIRHGEESATHFRSERIECMNGSWYFAVRETHGMLGPFPTRQAAQKAACAYIKDIESGRSDVEALSNLRVLMKTLSSK